MHQPRDKENPVLPTPELRAHAAALLHQLHGERARFVLWDRDGGEPIELDEALFELLRNVLIDLSQNRAVQILPHDMELTTVQAAEFLGVSRPFVIKSIDQGRLACRLVGTHRRIRLDDLIRYRNDMAERGRVAREEMTKDAEKLGWGY